MSAETTVVIEQGALCGKTCKGYNGQVFYSFEGIPYAKPPVGNLRFKVSIILKIIQHFRICYNLLCIVLTLLEHVLL